MKSIIRSFLGIGLVLLAANGAWAVPFNGPSVSIQGADFAYDGTTRTFSTVGGNQVIATFFDADGNQIAEYLDASFEVAPINFSAGFSNGSGGTFTLSGNGMFLLKGEFAAGSVLFSEAAGVPGFEFDAGFEASLISSFANSDTLPTFSPPGHMSVDLGFIDFTISDETVDQSFQVYGTTATIESSVTPVPEPTSLLLLGSGLAVFALWGRRNSRHSLN